VKDHGTGRRRRFERPESEWVRRELPEARIVDPEFWDRVQEVKRAKQTVYVTGPTCYLSLDAGQARDPEDLRARRTFGSGGFASYECRLGPEAVACAFRGRREGQR
jgi:hypothetical protein